MLSYLNYVGHHGTQRATYFLASSQDGPDPLWVSLLGERAFTALLPSELLGFKFLSLIYLGPLFLSQNAAQIGLDFGISKLSILGVGFLLLSIAQFVDHRCDFGSVVICSGFSIPSFCSFNSYFSKLETVEIIHSSLESPLIACWKELFLRFNLYFAQFPFVIPCRHSYQSRHH